MKIGILIDSASTSTPEILEGTIIEWIPLHVTFPDGTDALDTVEIFEKLNILQRVANGEPLKTSQASPGELEKKYDELLTKYDHIIHIPIPGNLSSMLQTSFMTASDEKYDGKVTVFENNDMAATAILKMALDVQESINLGDISTVEEAIDFIKRKQTDTYIGIIPGDLKRLSSGGRASSALASVLNLFRTKVLIKWASKPEKEAIGRTYSSLVEKIIAKLKLDEYKNGYEFVFMKTPLTSEKIVTNIKNTLKENKIIFKEELVPNIYVVHAGVDTVAFAIMKK